MPGHRRRWAGRAKSCSHGLVGYGAGIDRFEISLGLHPLRALRTCLSHGNRSCCNASLRPREEGKRARCRAFCTRAFRCASTEEITSAFPRKTFLFLLEDLGAELAEELPGFEVPIDKKGAKYLFTINSKEPFGEPEDMMYWWRILYAANESWTTTSENWEGVNWGLFTGDDESMKTVVGRIVKNYKELECEYLVLPE